ncbi:MAG: DHA2 family efflux MFS transporter permease subunit [Nitrospirota bacterium]
MNKWLIAFSVILPTFIEIVDTTIVMVSLDHIRGTFSAGVDEVTWILTSYLVSNAIVIPMTGWLSRLLGRKNYLMLSIAVFTASSFLCGIAWSLESLIFFRILQGIGGGGLQPLSQAILLESFPKKQHGMAMAVFGIGILFGPIIGPLLGGWISDNWSWQWIFFINIPIGIFSIFMNMIVIKDPPYVQKTKMRIDYFGLALLIIGLGALQLVIEKGQREDWFSSYFILSFFVVAVVSLVLFVIVEFFSEQPVVNLRIFKDPSFSAGTVVMFFSFFNLMSSIVMLPLYLQTLMGYTATLAGMVIGLGGIVTVLVMPVTGALIQKTDPRYPLTFGILMGALAIYTISKLNLYSDFQSVLITRMLLGVGMGFLMIPLMTISMSHIKKEEIGNAAGINNLVRNVGGSMGIAFATTMLVSRSQVRQVQLVEHLNPFDLNYQIASQKLSQAIVSKGYIGDYLSTRAAEGLMYAQLLKQSAMLSFNDVAFVSFIIMLCILPLVLILRKGGRGADSKAQPLH